MEEDGEDGWRRSWNAVVWEEKRVIRETSHNWRGSKPELVKGRATAILFA